MAVSNPYVQYQANQINTAGPDKLLLMAYDGAIRFARTGIEGIRSGDLYAKSTGISKCQAIIAELLTTLDPRPNPELAVNLANLYDYTYNRLSEANINDDEAAAAEVIGILTDLRQAWAQAAQIWRGQSPEGGPAE